MQAIAQLFLIAPSIAAIEVAQRMDEISPAIDHRNYI